MNEQDKHLGDTEPQIDVNDYGTTRESAVVVNEPKRTVLLTETETVVIDKPTPIEITPANRPRKVYKGMWGPTEIAAFGVSLLTILGIAALYLFFVVPSNSDLEQARADRDRLERERKEAQSKYGNITNTQEHVAKLLTSVDDFESNYLPVAANGRTSLYQRINSLIVGYGLLNTNGPDFAPLEPINGNAQGGESRETGRARFQSLFPGVYVTMTVEGSYQNLRRFLREIETGNEFVLISSVELEPSDSRTERENPNQQTGQPGDMYDPTRGQVNPNFGQQPAQPRRPQGRTVGEVVSLRLEMAAYFRRVNALAAPGTESPAQN